MSGRSEARDGGDRKRSHDRSNPRQKMPPDPRRGHCVLDNGTVLLPLPTGPPLSIFPAPSSHGLTRSPGKTHLISAYPRREGAAQPLVCGFGEAHPEATPQLQGPVPPPRLPPTCGLLPLENRRDKQKPFSLGQWKGLTTSRMRTRDFRRQFQTPNQDPVTCGGGRSQNLPFPL